MSGNVLKLSDPVSKLLDPTEILLMIYEYQIRLSNQTNSCRTARTLSSISCASSEQKIRSWKQDIGSLESWKSVGIGATACSNFCSKTSVHPACLAYSPAMMTDLIAVYTASGPIWPQWECITASDAERQAANGRIRTISICTKFSERIRWEIAPASFPALLFATMVDISLVCCGICGSSYGEVSPNRITTIYGK